MNVEPVIDTEVVEPLNREAAERLDRRIRLLTNDIAEKLTKLYDLVQEAKAGQIHAALGFASWTAYVADALTIQVRLEPGQRRELVSYLSGEGMSQRAIAEVVGASVGTVSADLSGVQNRTPSTGLDGKTFKRRNEFAAVPNPDAADEAKALAQLRGWVVHPAIELYPMISDRGIQAMADSIAKIGLLAPVTLWRDDGAEYLLDGRIRLAISS